MAIPRLYIPVQISIGQTLSLSKDQSHYVESVLRLRAGSQLCLFDGAGGEYEGILETHPKQTCRVLIKNFTEIECESPLRITLVQGISKGERMDYSIQKAVELGVNAIIPVKCIRSQFSLQGERLDRKVQHWQQIVVHACQQSGRNRVPTVHGITPFVNLFSDCTNKQFFLLDPANSKQMKAITKPREEIFLLIGPEGGFDENEIAVALTHGAQAIQLGPRILRTETAGVAALAAMQTLWGDF